MSTLELEPDDQLREICQAIAGEGRSADEWSAHESCDMFQTPSYCGGFDAGEQAFCFSYYERNGKEWWFQLSLSEVTDLARGNALQLRLRAAQ